MPSDRFNKLLPFVFSHECVFAKGHYGDYNHVITEDVPGDGGKITKWGIDLSGHPSLTAAQIRNLTKEQATDIYWQEWQKNKCESLAYPLGEAYADVCINCGVSRAQKLLATCGASFEKFQNERISFYHRLAEAKPRLEKFLKGWIQRVNDLTEFVK